MELEPEPLPAFHFHKHDIIQSISSRQEPDDIAYQKEQG